MWSPRRRPLLLLDVDGVLNPFMTPGVPEGFTPVRGRWHSMLLNPVHGVWIAELARWYEPVWFSARGEDVLDDVSPALGLPRYRVAVVDGLYDTDSTFKLGDAQRLVGDRRPFCWIDDDLHDDATAWVEGRRGPGLLLRPDPAVGLTWEHVQSAQGFAWRL